LDAEEDKLFGYDESEIEVFDPWEEARKPRVQNKPSLKAKGILSRGEIGVAALSKLAVAGDGGAAKRQMTSTLASSTPTTPEANRIRKEGFIFLNQIQVWFCCWQSLPACSGVTMLRQIAREYGIDITIHPPQMSCKQKSTSPELLCLTQFCTHY